MLKESKKIRNKLKRKVSLKLIEKIGIEEFRLLSRMITIFESRHGNQFSFSHREYKVFLEKCGNSMQVNRLLNNYLCTPELYCFPTLTLRIPQKNGGKVEIKNITIKKLILKNESKYYSKFF